MQTLGLLESQDHVTVGLPSLLLNISPKVLGERFCGEFAVGADLSEVGLADGNDVIIRCQEPVTGQGLHAVGCLPAQQGLDLLRGVLGVFREVSVFGRFVLDHSILLAATSPLRGG